MLDLMSTDGCEVDGEETTVIFLDEFRLMVLTPDDARDPDFTLFDTLVPHNHPVGSRRFQVPMRYYDLVPIVYVDGERCLGVLDQDRPLTTDPTQAIFVMKLVSPNEGRVLLVARIHDLIGHMYSMSPDGCMPWEEWGRSAVVMEVPEHASTGEGPDLLVQGVHVALVAMHTGYGAPPPALSLHL